MPAQRHLARRAAPAPAVNERADPAACRRDERPQTAVRQGLTPRPEQGRHSQTNPVAHEYDAGWLECHQRPIAARPRDPTVGRSPRRLRADPGGNNHDSVGRKHLHVYTVSWAGRAATRRDWGPANRWLKSRAAANRTGFADQRHRERSGRLQVLSAATTCERDRRGKDRDDPENARGQMSHPAGRSFSRTSPRIAQTTSASIAAGTISCPTEMFGGCG